MSKISKIRNFCIIAHIDHGKSTLADRLLEITGARTEREIKSRTMDTLELEQERGITIKLQTARMPYEYNESSADTGEYILNLIDTPGHVDFSYEVSRSVASCEGALLLIDVTQGIQAQTLSNMYKAMDHDLTVIPVLNKVDLPNADTERIKLEVMEAFGFTEEEIIQTSAKTGLGAKEVLDAIVERIPAPTDKSAEVPRAMIFDSFYHEYKGVVALIKVDSGTFSSNDKFHYMMTQLDDNAVEIGYLTPQLQKQEQIFTGEVGYIATGLKDIKQINVGDTLTVWQEDNSHLKVDPLPGYREAKPMVFASLYPVEASDFDEFSSALEKLALNDAALTLQREYSQALGSGYVCGFLGLLHLEIVQERLEREFGIDLISTTPSVEFKAKLTTADYSKLKNFNMSQIDDEGYLRVRTAATYPDGSLIESVMEPWVKLEVFTPEEYVGGVMELCQQNRGVYTGMEFLQKDDAVTGKHAIISYEIPSIEIMVNFFDKLKSLSHGYASMDYEFLEYRTSNIVKVAVLVNYEEAEALSFLVHRDNAERRGREMVDKLAKIIPKQQFKVPIQAGIGGKIIARSDIQAFRKDVTAKLYGGDETRKKKLLEKQKKGKKKMKTIGKVQIPKEAFLAALKND